MNRKGDKKNGASSASRGRGRGSANFNGRGNETHARGSGQDAPSRNEKPPLVLSNNDISRHINSLCRYLPRIQQPSDTASKVFGSFARQCFTIIFNSQLENYEAQLLWLFSQPLFTALPSELMREGIEEKDVVGATNLLWEFFNTPMFRKDKIAYACIRRSPDTLMRYIIVLAAIRTRKNLDDFRSYTLDHLDMILNLLRAAKDAIPNMPISCITRSGQREDGIKTFIADECDLMIQLAQHSIENINKKKQYGEGKNALASRGITNASRRGNKNNGASIDGWRFDLVIARFAALSFARLVRTFNSIHENDGDDIPDDLFEQGYIAREQLINFEPTYQIAVVDPTLEELIRDPESEDAIADEARARRITFGAEITSFRHHLDNVFFTTRHDALQPLKEGIQQLFANNFQRPKRGEDPLQVKVLFDLVVAGVSASPEYGPMFVFSSKSLSESAKRNKSIGKRRLLPGSIVVLTHDKLQTGEVCVVVRSEQYDILKGFVCLRRAEEYTVRHEDLDRNATLGPLKNMYATYTLIESTVYWETHVHALKAMQNLRDPGTPLFQHLRCAPENLQNNGILWKSIEDIDPIRIQSFTFDASQRRAYEHIFRSPAPIVQGPPGTGKSYIGVAALRTMLHENIHNDAPILVVCYTNHAIDAFLTDLIESEKEMFGYDLAVQRANAAEKGNGVDADPIPEESPMCRLVRLGFRSKSDILKQFVLPRAKARMGGFIGARKKLEQQWEYARATNFIPTTSNLSNENPATLSDTPVNRHICTYFENIKKSHEHRYNSAQKDLHEAEEYHKEVFGKNDPLDKIEIVEKALKEVLNIGRQKKDSKNQKPPFTMDTVTIDEAIEAFGAHSTTTICALAIDVLEDYPFAVDFIRAKNGGRTLTADQREAIEQLDYARAKVEQARAKFLSFLTVWRDEKGVLNNEADISDLPEETKAQDNNDDDFGDENEDRFLEQADDFVAGDNRREAPARVIRAVAVNRPAFLDLINTTNHIPTQAALNALDAAGRYELYNYLCDQRLRASLPGIAASITEVSQEKERFKAAVNDMQRAAISKARVIGCTTTGLARYLPMLAAIGVKCVILEEAAEIPECHALATILPTVTHLIQIGDHQQLRPKIAAYENRCRNLDISLMERMLRCNNTCETLSVQRRMRPAIADFIRPLYVRKLTEVGLTLEDHPRVHNYPQCPSKDYGLDANRGFVLYVNHKFPEARNVSQSYENKAEALFSVMLAWYLTHQRPESSITILVPYAGQVLCTMDVIKQYSKTFSNLRDHDPKTGERKVRIVSIDDFQGEESDVIILSLVRSSNPGFLRENNRICVALSRARHLQIVLGNFSVFEKFRKSYWPAVFNHARNTPGGIHDSLTLHCPTHEKTREFSPSSNFVRKDGQVSCDEISLLGGCSAICRQKRECGHMCESLCHGNIDCIEVSLCNKPCALVGSECKVDNSGIGKPRTCNHPCTKKCHEICGQCFVLVPSKCACGTELNVYCYLADPSYKTYHVKCPRRATFSLSCGHKKEASCYEINVQKNIFICDAICEKPHGDCGHKCRDQCKNCCISKIVAIPEKTSASAAPPPQPPIFEHTPCSTDCSRRLVCGHKCSSPCSNICPPCDKPCPNRCSHHKQCTSKNHKCGENFQKCTPCKESKCDNKCEHTRCTLKCSDVCNREECNRQCSKMLPCGHQCRGLCGEDCLKRCVQCKPIEDEEIMFGDEQDDDALFIQLECGHMFVVDSFDEHMKSAEDFTNKAISQPTCPTCTSPIYPHGGIRRYKPILNRIRSVVDRVKARAVEIQRLVESELADAEGRIKTLKAGVQHEARFRRLPNLRNSIVASVAFYQRVVENKQARNLQLTSAMCHRVSLIHSLYMTALPLSGLSGNALPQHPMAGDDAFEEAILSLLKVPNTANGAEMDTAVKLPLLKSLRQEYDPEYSSETLSDILISMAKMRNLRASLSSEEKEAIVRALHDKGEIQRQGAFRRCGCGYIYAIGDCGGAMVIATCPECKNPIGGENHRDVANVRHEGGIDGSTRNAWS